MPADGTHAQPVRVLLAGESWSSYGANIKGFNAYYTGFYDEGGAPLIGALEAGGCVVTYQPNHVAATHFPDSAAALDAYDVVVLSDIGSDTLLLHPDTFRASQVRPDRLAVLADWVRGGGGLLMIGGYMRPDRGTCGRLAAGHGMPARTSWPASRGRGRPSWATTGWRGRVDSGVLLRHETDPFLTIRDVGAGRTAAFASDCSPHWGSPELTEWPAYPRSWTQLVEWLAARR